MGALGGNEIVVRLSEGLDEAVINWIKSIEVDVQVAADAWDRRVQ